VTPPAPRGLFLTLEGGDGAGKSTQSALLADALRARGHDVVTTREPGGTPEGEALRALLVRPGLDWDARAEALLFFAARAALADRVIRPALAAGRVVVCDRFADSSRAYQGHAGGVPLEDIEALARIALRGLEPDLTLILDADPAAALARAGTRADTGGEDRFERRGPAFQERLRAGYRAIAAAHPARCRLIDAARPREAVAAEILTLALEALAGG
jgi:dTMP kinase